jgi:hypothetical protein
VDVKATHRVVDKSPKTSRKERLKTNSLKQINNKILNIASQTFTKLKFRKLQNNSYPAVNFPFGEV